MKAVLFAKAQNKDIVDTIAPGFLRVITLAVSYDNSSPDILFRLESDVYSVQEIKDKYGAKVDFLTPSEAQDLGKVLQPDRTERDPITDEEILIRFSLQVSEADLDKQVSQDINALGELKAYRLFMKHTLRTLYNMTSIPALTQEEIDYFKDFINQSDIRYSEFETEKTNFGF